MDYSKTVSGGIGSSQNIMTLELTHADSCFTVFPDLDGNSRTCFKNPGIEYQLKVAGKYYPPSPVKTFDDLRSLNMTFDALNINNSLTCSVSTDVATSMQPFTKYRECAANGAVTTKKQFTAGDRSKYFIGIPFADSEDFQGGVTTGGAVQIELLQSKLPATETWTSLYNREFGRPVTYFLQDMILKIRAMKPPGLPQISLTNATIEQIEMSQGRL